MRHGTLICDLTGVEVPEDQALGWVTIRCERVVPNQRLLDAEVRWAGFIPEQLRLVASTIKEGGGQDEFVQQQLNILQTQLEAQRDRELGEIERMVVQVVEGHLCPDAAGKLQGVLGLPDFEDSDEEVEE